MDFYEELQVKLSQMDNEQRKEFILLVEQYLQDQESSPSVQE